MKKFKKNDMVIANEPGGYCGVGIVEGFSPSTSLRRGRALDGSLQWRYKIKTMTNVRFIDENYLQLNINI